MRIVRRQNPGDALAVFAGLLRFLAGEIRHAGAGMGVEQEEGFVLLLQVVDHERQKAMFHDVGEMWA